MLLKVMKIFNKLVKTLFEMAYLKGQEEKIKLKEINSFVTKRIRKPVY